MSHCKSPKCRAPVAWITTPAGKPMIVNPGAIAIKDYEVGTPRTTIVDCEGEVHQGTLIGSMDDADYLQGLGHTIKRGFVPHWSTCKDPEVFKKGRKKKG